EAVLRERMQGRQLRQLQHAAAFVNDAPPSRVVFFEMPAAVQLPSIPEELRPLSDLLRLKNPNLRQLLQEWLHGVYIVEDVNSALAKRDRLPAQAMFVDRQGHIVDQYSVRFYAPDNDQAGMLARQQA